MNDDLEDASSCGDKESIYYSLSDSESIDDDLSDKAGKDIEMTHTNRDISMPLIHVHRSPHPESMDTQSDSKQSTPRQSKALLPLQPSHPISQTDNTSHKSLSQTEQEHSVVPPTSQGHARDAIGHDIPATPPLSSTLSDNKGNPSKIYPVHSTQHLRADTLPNPGHQISPRYYHQMVGYGQPTHAFGAYGSPQDTYGGGGHVVYENPQPQFTYQVASLAYRHASPFPNSSGHAASPSTELVYQPSHSSTNGMYGPQYMPPQHGYSNGYPGTFRDTYIPQVGHTAAPPNNSDSYLGIYNQTEYSDRSSNTPPLARGQLDPGPSNAIVLQQHKAVRKRSREDGDANSVSRQNQEPLFVPDPQSPLHTLPEIGDVNTVPDVRSKRRKLPTAPGTPGLPQRSAITQKDIALDSFKHVAIVRREQILLKEKQEKKVEDERLKERDGYIRKIQELEQIVEKSNKELNKKETEKETELDCLHRGWKEKEMKWQNTMKHSKAEMDTSIEKKMMEMKSIVEQCEKKLKEQLQFHKDADANLKESTAKQITEMKDVMERKERDHREEITRLLAQKDNEVASLVQKINRRTVPVPNGSRPQAVSQQQEPAPDHNIRYGRDKDIDCDANFEEPMAVDDDHDVQPPRPPSRLESSSVTTSPSNVPPPESPSKVTPSSKSKSSSNRGSSSKVATSSNPPKTIQGANWKDINARFAEKNSKKRVVLQAVAETDEEGDSSEEESKIDEDSSDSDDEKSKKGEDGDNSNDEDDIGTPNKRLLKLVTRTVTTAIKDLFPEREPGKKGKKPMRTSRRGRRNTVKDELAMDERWERAAFCELVRQVMKDAFDVEKVEDYALHRPPSLQAVRNYGAGNGDGPNPNDLRIDMRTEIGSSWNKEVLEILLHSVLAKRCEADWNDQPERSDDYFRVTIKKQLERARTTWKNAQPQLGEDGEVETLNEVEQRMIVKKEAEDKSGRAYSRRRSRYDRRLTTIQRMIEKKGEQNALDTDIWKWLEGLILGLGEDGMSSDESENDEDTGQDIFYVKKMEWRPRIDMELSLIDRQRRLDTELWSRRGAKPVTRIRSGAHGASRREPPVGLRKGLYNKEWLKSLSDKGKRDLNISMPKFQWVKILH